MSEIMANYYHLAQQYITEVMLEAEGINPAILPAYLKPNYPDRFQHVNELYE